MTLHFATTAVAAGLTIHDAATFAALPDRLGQELQANAKRLARFLNTAHPGRGHRKLLEAVATAAGFPSWHAFQQVIQSLGSPALPAGNACCEACVSALALLLRITPGIPPSPAQQVTLQRFCQRLATALNLPEADVQNVVAKLHDADTWSALLAQGPTAEGKPLYQFVADGRDSCFVWSDRCEALVSDLDNHWQGYGDMEGNARLAARRYVLTCAARTPSFLEGQLALGTVYDLEGEPEKAGPIFAAALKAANALIPPGFRGQIPWSFFENRFYHRLLYAAMRWNAEFGEGRLAVQLAKRQLRLNPSDNLGVRYSLPVLQASAGDLDGAMKSLTKISDGASLQDGYTLLVRSLCHAAHDDLAQGEVLFLRGLFAFPALRPILLDHALPGDFHTAMGKWTRGVIPDLDTLWFDFGLMWRHHPRCVAMILALLESAAVVEAEAELAALYQTASDTDHPGFQRALTQWKTACIEKATALSAAMGMPQ